MSPQRKCSATLKRDARTLGVSSRDLAPALGANEPEELESRSKIAHLDVWGKALEGSRGQLRIEKHTLRTQVARHEEHLRGLIYPSYSSLDAQGEAVDSKTLGVKARITRRLAAEHERRALLQAQRQHILYSWQQRAAGRQSRRAGQV